MLHSLKALHEIFQNHRCGPMGEARQLNEKAWICTLFAIDPTVIGQAPSDVVSHCTCYGSGTGLDLTPPFNRLPSVMRTLLKCKIIQCYACTLFKYKIIQSVRHCSWLPPRLSNGCAWGCNSNQRWWLRSYHALDLFGLLLMDPWLRELVYWCGIRNGKFNFFAWWGLS